jgi:predicted porin
MMRQTLLALAVTAVTGAAHAQSNVTLFGIVDVTYQHLRGDGNGNWKRLHNSGYNSSRLGFRGMEDLGGGMAAGFWLEAGLNNDSGAGAATNTNNQTTGNALAGISGGQGLTFNRRSTVSLHGPFGEVRIGRDNTASFWTLNIFDPFLNVGAGNALNLSIGAGRGTSANPNMFGSARLSNTVAYLTPATLGGFYAHAMLALGENPSNADKGASKDGNYRGLRVGYANGTLQLALGHGHTKFSAGSSLGGDYVHSNAGASYNFGPVTLMGQWFTDSVEATTKTGQRGWLLGATGKVGAGELRASLIDVDVAQSTKDGRQWAVGYIHHLSKRTAVYTTYARVQNRGNGTLFHNGRPTTVPGGGTAGLDVGLRHAF